VVVPVVPTLIANQIFSAIRVIAEIHPAQVLQIVFVPEHQHQPRLQLRPQELQQYQHQLSHLCLTQESLFRQSLELALGLFF
jgi:hypothetical protein